MQKYYNILSIFFLTVSLFLLSGCSTTKQPTINKTKINISEDISKAFDSLPQDNEVLSSVKDGIKLIKEGKYKQANDLFAKGLRLNPNNGNLHFLNALAYHLRAQNGSVKISKLAEVGYKTALKFDKTNYWAAYFLGSLYFNQQRFLEAQNQFAYALIYAPKNPYILRALAVTSYYLNDPTITYWASKKAYELDPNNSNNIRNLMFSQAAIGDIENAKKNLQKYKKLINNKNNNFLAHKLFSNHITKRIEDWDRYYKVVKKDTNSNNSVFGTTSDNSEGLLNLDGIKQTDYQPDSFQTSDIPTISKQALSSTPNKKIKAPKMVLIDVVIIKTEENRSQAKGINLLDGLVTTLTGTLIGYTHITGPNAITFTNETPSLELAGLEYNFNIFNDGVNKAEVLARPSLLAINNKKSLFYSGAVLHVQLSSNNVDGSLVDIPIGIHLEVTPVFLDDNTIQVEVHAERSFLETVSTKVGFSAFSQSSKTSVDATAVLKFNDTLVLSGLYENEKSHTKSGVPLLQDIPGVQYFFSRDTEAEYKRSILILLTPRKARYTNRTMTLAEKREELKKQIEYKTKYVTELKTKHKAISNLDAIFAHLQNKEYYRQFRTGDLKLDDWETQIADSLKRALEFLYY